MCHRPRSASPRSASPLSCLAGLLPAVALVVGLALVALPAPPAAAQGYNLLVGGGSADDDCDLTDGDWSDRVYGWFVDRAALGGPNGGNGKVLILDYATYAGCTDTNPPGDCTYLSCLGAVQVDHVCVTARGGGGCLKAGGASTYDLITGYDALWFRGGDQSQYTAEWAGTLTEDAIYFVWSNGGVLGGTSAGAMMQSEVVSTGSSPSWEATSDPYNSSIAFETGFLDGAHAVLPGTLVDSHFTGRARMGRLATLLGLQLQDAGRSLTGVGVDTETGFAVTPDGIGEVMGEGSVWILAPSASTAVDLQNRRPPYVSDLTTHVLTEGFRYDLGSGSLVTVPASATAAGTAPALSFVAGTVSGADDADQALAEHRVGNLTDTTALWYGNLSLLAGSGGVDDGVVMTNLEDVTDQRENRAGGPVWAMAETASHGLAVYTDGYAGDACNGVSVNTDETLTALAAGCPDEQSVLVVDCCGLEWVDQSTWDEDGNGLPRQSGALTPCTATLFNSQVGVGTYAARCGGGTSGPVCGDGTCDSGESPCSCEADCGAPPSTETFCSDGLDDDCDGLVDGDDPDCAVACAPVGDGCTVDGDCCSGKCRGPAGRMSCK